MSGTTKIMHVTTSVAGGGAEMMLCNMLERLDPSRFENIVVTTQDAGMRSPAPRIRESVSAFYDLGVTAIRLKGLLALYGIIRRERPDIVQTWMHKADFFGGLMAKLAAVHNVVWGIHSRDVYRSPGAGEWKTTLFKKLLGAGSWLIPKRIISCSKSAVESHRKMGYSNRKMEWIGNGVDTDRFRPSADAALKLRVELGIPIDAPVVGFVGRFHPVKDIPTFLDGAEVLLQRFPNVHFVLCGDAAAEQVDTEIAASIDRFPVREQLHFIPFREDIENVYPLFDIFSLTSVSEAFPMVLLEAMACGIPCVSTDTGDALAIIEATGKVVPTKDSQSLAAAWRDLLELQRDERDLLGSAARSRCQDLFSLSACVARYESVYQQLMTK